MTGQIARTMFVGAHLDDIELAAGGTSALIESLGGEVYWLVLSESEYVRYDGTMRRDRDTALREGKAAASSLGVTHLDVRDFPAKDIDNHSSVVEAIDEVINQFNPTMIFTHWPFDTHRSHANTSLTTIAAGRRHNSVLLYEPIVPAGRSYVAYKPEVYVCIDKVIDRKLDALRCHASELSKYGEAWIEGVLARARFRGFELGRRYAESFELLRLELDFDAQ
jgi:LmbE family N-acetylglucosaminyl deacetylase